MQFLTHRFAQWKQIDRVQPAYVMLILMSRELPKGIVVILSIIFSVSTAWFLYYWFIILTNQNPSSFNEPYQGITRSPFEGWFLTAPIIISISSAVLFYFIYKLMLKGGKISLVVVTLGIISLIFALMKLGPILSYIIRLYSIT